MYQDQWSKIKFSEQEKKEMTEQLYTKMQQTKQVQQPKPFRLWHRPLRQIAIVVLLVTFVSVVGYATTSIRNVIQDTLQGSPTAMAELKKDISYLGRTKQWKGWSMTLTDVVGDYADVFVGFEIKTPENITLNPEYEYTFEDIKIRCRPRTGETMGYMMPWLTVVDEHTLTGVLQIQTDASFQNRKVSFKFSGLYNVFDELDTTSETERYIRHTCTEEYEEINGHSFRFWNVPLDYTTMPITLTPNDAVSVFQGDAVVTKIVISPLSVTARAEGEGCKDHHWKPTSRPEAYHDSTLKALDGSVYNQGCLRELNLKVILKDGSEVKSPHQSGSCEDKKEPYYLQKTKRFDHVIDLQDIDYIEVCGNRYTIPSELLAKE